MSRCGASHKRRGTRLASTAGIRRHSEAVLQMISTREVLMNLNSEELVILAELLESARTRLLVEIRHTHHRAFRDELRHRLTLVEGLVDRCGSGMSAGSAETGTGV